MSRRHKKKRNKAYRGEDAAEVAPVSEPVVHRYSAVQRSKAGEWWHDHKKAVRFGSIAGAVVLFLSWMLFELFRLVF